MYIAIYNIFYISASQDLNILDSQLLQKQTDYACHYTDILLYNSYVTESWKCPIQ